MPRPFDLDRIKAAAQRAQDASLRDSNDEEIELLREALDEALAALGLELPEPRDEDEDVEVPVARVSCPRCKGTNVAFDWVGLTSIRFINDRVMSATIGGVLGGLPDKAVCFDCDEVADTTQAHLWPVTAAMTLIDEQLPSHVLDDLNNGNDLWRVD